MFYMTVNRVKPNKKGLHVNQVPIGGYVRGNQAIVLMNNKKHQTKRKSKRLRQLQRKARRK